MSTQVSAELVFICPYCEARNEVDPALADCVVVCAECARSVLAPVAQNWAQLTLIVKPLPGKWVRLLLIVVGILFGGLIGSLIMLLPMWYYTLSIVGLGVRHIFAAGALGAALGAFFGGLLVYWTTRE